MGAQSRGQTPGGSKGMALFFCFQICLKDFFFCLLVSLKNLHCSAVSWPKCLAQTLQPDVCSQLPSPHPTTSSAHFHTNTHTHGHTLVFSFKTELKPWAETCLPSLHQLAVSSGAAWRILFLLFSLFPASLLNAGMRGSIAWSIQKKRDRCRGRSAHVCKLSGSWQVLFFFFSCLQFCAYTTPADVVRAKQCGYTDVTK